MRSRSRAALPTCIAALLFACGSVSDFAEPSSSIGCRQTLMTDGWLPPSWLVMARLARSRVASASEPRIGSTRGRGVSSRVCEAVAVLATSMPRLPRPLPTIRCRSTSLPRRQDLTTVNTVPAPTTELLKKSLGRATRPSRSRDHPAQGQSRSIVRCAERTPVACVEPRRVLVVLHAHRSRAAAHAHAHRSSSARHQDDRYTSNDQFDIRVCDNDSSARPRLPARATQNGSREHLSVA
jgi:hypothetical protein